MKQRPARPGSQRELAERLGCTPAMLSAWKLGKVNVSVAMAAKWAKVLNVDALRLLTASVRDRPKILGFK